MDFSSTLKNEIFRPLTTIVVPGSVAIAPFVLLLGHYVPGVRVFWQLNAYGFGFILLISILASGLVLEDFGSRIEVVWDYFLEKKYPGRRENWREYLTLKVQDEYIGQRFLRTIFTRFKFELSMGPAVIAFTVGLIWLNNIYSFWQGCNMFFIAVLLFGFSIYILRESYDSADQLGDLHKRIVAAVRASEKLGIPPTA